MSDDGIRCKKCSYDFAKSLYEEKDIITCPYCKKKGSEQDFEILNEVTSGDGYAITLSDFEYFLKNKSSYHKRDFFKKDVKFFSIVIKGELNSFKDKKGKDIPMEEVHAYIQNDIVLQRKLYNLYYVLAHY